LGALFGSPVGADLTCKGGTSLSKAYRIIDRFSEDLDLTCDIRRLAGSLQLVPQGAAREALAADYDGMLEDQVMVGDALPFQDLMAACEEVASRANAAAGP